MLQLRCVSWMMKGKKLYGKLPAKNKNIFEPTIEIEIEIGLDLTFPG